MQCNVALYSVSVCFIILCSSTYTTNGQRISTYQWSRRCGSRNFECNSGDCISDYNLCDGKADCRDNSDETEEACSDINCPRFIYRCNYGACVNARARCNGIRECLDGSDEDFCGATTPPPPVFAPSTTSRRPASSKPVQPVNCLIPNDPANGIYTIGGRPPGAYRTGDSVVPFSVLITNCDNGYQPSITGVMYSVCANGIWTPVPSSCSRFSQSSNPANPVECQCYC